MPTPTAGHTTTIPGATPGRTRWRRFAVVLTGALALAVAMCLGIVEGVLPVALALDGQQRIKITAEEFGGIATGAFPQFFETEDGERHTVVVVGLDDVRLRALCASGSVPTPIGTYVLRLTTPVDGDPVQAGSIRFAVESLDGLGLAGQQLLVNRDATAPDGTPRDAGSPGSLPIQTRALTLDLSATVRWATVDSLALTGLDLTLGDDVPECF